MIYVEGQQSLRLDYSDEQQPRIEARATLKKIKVHVQRRD